MKSSLVLDTASVSGDEVRMTAAMPSSGNEESEVVFCQADSTSRHVSLLRTASAQHQDPSLSDQAPVHARRL